MRYAIFISGGGSFARVVHQNAGMVPDASTSVVICDRLCPAYQFFKEQTDIPTYLFDYAQIQDRDLIEKEILLLLAEHRIDYLLLNYNRLLGPVLLGAYGDKIYNLHWSLLPLFKGFGALNKAYDSDVMFFGSTIHQVDASMDGGSIISQVTVPKIPGESKQAFLQRHYEHTALLFLDFVYKLTYDKLQRLEDGKLYFEKGAYGSPTFNPGLSIDADKVNLIISDYSALTR